MKFCKLPKQAGLQKRGPPAILGWNFCLETQDGLLLGVPGGSLEAARLRVDALCAVLCCAVHVTTYTDTVSGSGFEFAHELMYHLNYQVDFLSFFSYFLYQFY